jgi:hypothetical protein
MPPTIAHWVGAERPYVARLGTLHLGGLGDVLDVRRTLLVSALAVLWAVVSCFSPPPVPARETSAAPVVLVVPGASRLVPMAAPPSSLGPLHRTLAHWAIASRNFYLT